MAAETYTTQVIVLRKTKLGETDLILTLLGSDGAQLRAVAKGARKPSNTFSARLELYSLAEVLCSKGRSLDIVKEARLLDGNEKLRIDLDYAAGAAPMAELLDKVTQLGLESPKLFAMTRAAFSVLNDTNSEIVPSITAAHLLKTLVFSGLRPSLTSCVSCGSSINFSKQGTMIHVSYREGGVLCDDCGSQEETILIQSSVVRWAHYLLTTSFGDISEKDIEIGTAFEVLQFCQAWIHEHVGANLKSLVFMFTSGLYDSSQA